MSGIFSDVAWQWGKHSTVEDKVLIKLLKAFSYQEKCTAVNIKFDLPKVQEIELGVHSVWCQWGFWLYCLAPEPWGFLCPLFALTGIGTMEKRNYSHFNVVKQRHKKNCNSQWANIDMVLAKFLTQNNFLCISPQYSCNSNLYCSPAAVSSSREL